VLSKTWCRRSRQVVYRGKKKHESEGYTFLPFRGDWKISLVTQFNHHPIQLEHVVLLAVPSSRSQAYIQALVHNGMFPEVVIWLGPNNVPGYRSIPKPKQWEGILLPNLEETVDQTCLRVEIPMITCPSSNVNDGAILDHIRALAPRILIYSGFGGQIVSEQTLSIGPKFLHMHSGWLPEYRGSTTLYYALLKNELPAVTALFLDTSIDTGPVVAKRHYPKPPFDIDIDKCYDSAIRADLLVRVMRDYVRTGRIDILEDQNPGTGETYYVIHPVLKHLAILSLKKEKGA